MVYSLTDSAEGHFSIEATTGVIRLEKPLRVRPQAALELTVRASDLGTPIPLSTLGTVTVSVVGLEDYLPVFLSTEHSVQVPEDAQRGTEVLQLATLTRPGAEKTGYRVVSGNEQGRFRLDARTGETAPGGSSTPTLNTRARAHTHTHCLTVVGHTGFFTYHSPSLASFSPFSTLDLSRYQVPSCTLGPAYMEIPLLPLCPHQGLCVEDPLLPLCSFTVPAHIQPQDAEATLHPWLPRHKAPARIGGLSSPRQGCLLPS